MLESFSDRETVPAEHGRCDSAEAVSRDAWDAEPDAQQRGLTVGRTRDVWLQNPRQVSERLWTGGVERALEAVEDVGVEVDAYAKEMIGDHVFPLLHRFLGVVYAAKQMNKEAVAELETYLKQDPKAKDTDQVKQAIADLKIKVNKLTDGS